MDLRSMLNEGSSSAAAAASAAAGKPPRAGSQQQQPPTQQQLLQHHQLAQRQQLQQQQQHQQHHPLPSTPIQTVPPHSFHDQPQSVHASPARTMSREFHPAHGTPFASPPAYSTQTPYAAHGRPQPPPLQQLASNNDMRSPSAGPPPARSPYTRATPTTAVRSDSGGYPFPSPSHPHPDTASPVQQHRHTPSTGYPPRDSYSQPSGPMPSPGPMNHPPPGYFQGNQHMPQTPPVGTPGVAHPYLAQQHQRSASAQSHQSHPSQSFTSPVVTNHPPPQPDHMRQPSQPLTPHGPPLSAGPRQPAAAGTFAQPSSPFQPRVSSSGAPYPPYPQHQQSLPPQQPPQQPPQPSPRTAPRPQPSPRTSIRRTPSIYDQTSTHTHALDPHRASLSQSDRDRSVSVSPKTRIPSLPSSTGHHSQASFSGPSGQPTELDSRQLPSNNTSAQMRDAPARLEREAPPVSATRPERASTPAKRKMDDRDIKPEDLDRQEPRPPPFQANGAHIPATSSRLPTVHPSDSPMPPRQKPRHAAPPVWAQLYERQQLKNANHVLRKPAVNHTHVNGTGDSNPPARQERATSRHVSPEASRSNTQGAPLNPAPPAPPFVNRPQLLGPWETTFSNQAPFDEMSKTVADFFFFHVVSHRGLDELHGRPGIQFEIEAKLGCLIDRDPQRQGGRYLLPIRSEVVLLEDKSAYAFSSSMTEAQHKNFNNYLNSLVAETSPQNPKNLASATPRVPVNYVHTREIDKFYRLPAGAQENLPPFLRHLLGARRDPSVRVTTDRSGRIVAKIVKAKVSDLHLSFPQCDLDCRISVNIEIQWDGPVEGLEQITQDGAGFRGDKPDRHKDRLSYTQGHYKVDLTQVTQPETGDQPNVKKIHELEIELDAEAVVDQGRRAMDGQPHNYDFLVEGFVNNIRLLSRKARELGQR